MSVSLGKISEKTKTKKQNHDVQGGAISGGLSLRLWESYLSFLSLGFLVKFF